MCTPRKVRIIGRAGLALFVALTCFSEPHGAAEGQRSGLDNSSQILHQLGSAMTAQPRDLPAGPLQINIHTEKVGFDNNKQTSFSTKPQTLDPLESKTVSIGRRQTTSFVLKSKGFLFPSPLSLPPPSHS